MTRKEAQNQILKHMKSIVKIAKEYAPESNYLTLVWLGDSISFNNDYTFNDNIEHAIDLYEEVDNE